MIKKGLETLAYHFHNSCLFMQTTDPTYVMEVAIETVDFWNEKHKKSKLKLFMYHSITGLMQYTASTVTGGEAEFTKIYSVSDKKVAGQEPKPVKTVPALIQTVNQRIQDEIKKTDMHIRGVIILNDFPDFSFPEDWFAIKDTINMDTDWSCCFLITSNRKDKIPSFMERYCTNVRLADFIEYNKDRIADWRKDILETIKSRDKLDEEKLGYKLEDRLNGMTTYEAANTINMIKAADSYSKEDMLGVIDYITKKPSMDLADANHVQLVIDNNTGFEMLGGLEVLKADMKEASQIFTNLDSEEIKKHKVPIPKSIILQGVQGGGKTATAKAIAKEFRSKFAIFNMANIFSGRLGDTEANIQSAINSFNELKPLVVLVDEIDKSMVGMESSGKSDGGTSARAIQTYLTYLSEDHPGVFLVHTANELDKLPPEFMRKGRHDNIYFVDIPTAEARKEIFKIHLQNLGTSKETIAKIISDQNIIGTLSDQFTGAEIEEAVKSAKRKAFIADPATCEITPELVIASLNNTKAICNVDPEKITHIREWGLKNAVKASLDHVEETIQHVQRKPRRSFDQPV